MELVKFNTQAVLDDRTERLQFLEAELFRLREAAENIWLEIARICSEIEEYKLYKHTRDEDGNYFRTARKYFEYLDQRFKERGWHASPGTINHWMGVYRLFVKEMQFSPDEVAALGVTNVKTLAPAVRQLQKEGRTEEAREMVSELVEVAQTYGGVPASEVNSAIDFLTGRVQKGVEAKFKKAMFGYQLDVLRLWWDGKPIDLLAKQQVTENQYTWFMRRLGQRVED